MKKIFSDLILAFISLLDSINRSIISFFFFYFLLKFGSIRTKIIMSYSEDHSRRKQYISTEWIDFHIVSMRDSQKKKKKHFPSSAFISFHKSVFVSKSFHNEDNENVRCREEKNIFLSTSHHHYRYYPYDIIIKIILAILLLLCFFFFYYCFSSKQAI
ncbi:hypothetical protein NH340_JMT04494 [Sarcoptes scabiei]|nr:hypothetical protein NH340_JMT04494 [Sarcoptes scabiei]